MTSTIIVITTQVAGKSHFTSWHGKFGLAACLGSLAAALGGLAAKYRWSLASNRMDKTLYLSLDVARV